MLKNHVLQLKTDCDAQQQKERLLDEKLKDQNEKMHSVQTEFLSASEKWQEEKSHLEETALVLRSEINELAAQVCSSFINFLAIRLDLFNRGLVVFQKSKLEEELSASMEASKQVEETNTKLKVSVFVTP